MTQTHQPEWPPLNAYVADSEVLGYQFEYPSEYLECIAWDQDDIDADGDGHALSFLTVDEVRSDLITFVRAATRRRLVPFARGGNGDELYCFDGEDAKTIYVINLGEKPLHVRNTGSASFVDFINAYRLNLDLPSWEPDKGGQGK